MKLTLPGGLFAAVLCLGSAASGFAQGGAGAEIEPPEPTLTLFFARTGQSLTTPYRATIHYAEFLQIRNRWIYPDIGYVDFAHNNYREFFIGGGRTLIENKFAEWEQELEFVQATGPAAGSARYLQPWSMLRLRFAPKLSSEIVYFSYLPLNKTAGFHQVIERAKAEYRVQKHWKIGAGYAGADVPGGPWINKPFLTTTISSAAGDFEFWLQKIPYGAQVELRYGLLHISHPPR
ncbi:MAG TPA: hypothetical protein VNZ56_02810 [Verrucomicrobiae bacterium]|nr:hypothetical protein [Verrucomicrobiae bacterium]